MSGRRGHCEQRTLVFLFFPFASQPVKKQTSRAARCNNAHQTSGRGKEDEKQHKMNRMWNGRNRTVEGNKQRTKAHEQRRRAHGKGLLSLKGRLLNEQ